MKKKTIALILTAAMSVMSSMPVMAAQSSTNYYGSSCYICGEDGVAPTVVGRRIDDIDAKLCQHGHAGEADVLRAIYETVRYYCSDCEVYWDEEEFAGMAWCCTYDD